MTCSRPSGRRSRRWAMRCGASLQGSRIAERLRDGFEVALVGRPERRQVDAPQRHRRAGGRAHLRGRRHHARRDRGPHGPRRPAADPARHGRPARRRRPRRGPRCRPCARAGGRGRPADLSCRRSGGDRLARRRLRGRGRGGARQGATCGPAAEGDAVSGRTGAGIDALLASGRGRPAAARRPRRRPRRTRGSARRSSRPPPPSQGPGARWRAPHLGWSWPRRRSARGAARA